MSNPLPPPPADEPVPQGEEPDQIEAAPETDERPAPNWFPRPYRREAPEELAERYRHLQQDPLLRVFRAGSRENDEFNRGFEPAQAPPNASEPKVPARRAALIRSALGKNFIFVSLAASVTGGLIGLTAAQFGTIKQATSDFAAATLAGFQQEGEKVLASPAAAATRKTVISMKPVATATLEVADANGTLNSMIPLILRAEPAAEGQTLALRISGLPEDAYLTVGTRVSGNSWLLNPGQEQDVKLVVPKANTPKFDVAVAAIETGTGELAAPMEELTEIGRAHV